MIRSRIRSREVLIDLMARSEAEFTQAELLGRDYEAQIALNSHQRAIEELEALDRGEGDIEHFVADAMQDITPSPSLDPEPIPF